MAVPDYQTIMLPLLRLAGSADLLTVRSAIERLADEFALSEADRRVMLPSGKQRSFDNRVGWARTYLTKAGLLDAPRRGQLGITPRGRDVLKVNPTRIDN